MSKTTIEWCDHSINPIRARDRKTGAVGHYCEKIAAGCTNCYSSALQRRFKMPTFGSGQHRDSVEIFLDESKLAEVRKRRKPTRYFWCDMTDIFGDWMKPEWLSACFQAMDATPQHTHILLTKRPENIRRMWPSLSYANPSLVESRVPVPGFPGYEVSNLGVVYSLSGSTKCCNCGKDTSADPGLARKKYCSGPCRQAAYKRSKQGGQRELYPATSRPLSPSVSDSGHCTVHLARDGHKHPTLVHRLVLATFCRPAAKGEEGRHMDGDPQNNRIDNLQWGSQSENWDDSKRHRTHRRYSKLTQDQVDEIRVSHQNGDTYSSLAIQYDVSATQIRNICLGKQWSEQPLAYRHNCWLLTSVSDQPTADRNIPELLKCRDLSPVLGVSYEPALGPVDFTRYINGICFAHDKDFGGTGPCEGHGVNDPWLACLDWIICGGESGPKARHCNVKWFRDAIEQCQPTEHDYDGTALGGVACFVKQLGAKPMTLVHPFGPCSLELRDSKGGDIDEFPEDLRVRQFPEVAK